MLANKKIRIANGQGFWGDSSQAPIDLVNCGNIDYLTMGFIQDSSSGYITDGTAIVSQSDDEGNDGGAYYYFGKKKQEVIL